MNEEHVHKTESEDLKSEEEDKVTELDNSMLNSSRISRRNSHFNNQLVDIDKDEFATAIDQEAPLDWDKESSDEESMESEDPEN
mmetsp:Transcript_36506/g.79527  ORF Transcript_36506/g.79527 Transcript_36506/m.79527 type:complete len:84 (+) Transcript_36506:1285-1536(+)|eukprot:CAMPEP_0116898074 /NCGR_PEP_ID=MMETSP0467-20121206/6866_1 /TAXON_ID=283647 /ORGANISM="Mesodinium pulex, Strain SPMC105" /LENGTH=83 /DNA_ID=CAMNT_0004569977 /DNA_START=2762 /DNA_END=3013 /DNA_ORIENTATION=-